MRRTYREIREMIEASLLQSKTARAIVRKSMVRPGSSQTTTTQVGSHIDLAGQYSKVTSELGDVLEYTSASTTEFPANTPRLRRYGDFRGFVWARVLVTVTRAAGAGVSLRIIIEQDVDGTTHEIAFEGGNPEVPLDVVGLQKSDFTRIEWIVDPDAERPAQSTWIVQNPTGLAGECGVGICQLQLRGDPA